jgi:hypothetical protein
VSMLHPGQCVLMQLEDNEWDVVPMSCMACASPH